MQLWRLHIHGLIYQGMHGFCDVTREEGCRLQCFANLQHHIQQYTSELSKVFFRKKALQSDRRWWLSVFYSLLIQAPVRQTLVMVHGEIHSEPLVNDAGTHSCRRYCYTVLNMFDAASAGWDPITSDDDLEPLLLGSDLEKELAKHVTVAREMELINHGHLGDETLSTFDFLRNLFEVDTDERVRRRVSTKPISSKDSTAVASEAASILKAIQTPHFNDSEYARMDNVKYHGSETELTTPAPPLPPPKLTRGEDCKGLRGYRAGVKKRRATSPPQQYEDGRRLSTDSFSQLYSSTDDVSDRANSLSSVNSYSSINAAYGTLGLDSPGSGQSSRYVSSSPQSLIPEHLRRSDIPRDMSAHGIIRQRAAKLGTHPVEKLQGFYECFSCLEKFDTREELW